MTAPRGHWPPRATSPSTAARCDSSICGARRCRSAATTPAASSCTSRATSPTRSRWSRRAPTSPHGIPVGFSSPGETVQFLNFWDPAHTNHALAINGKSGTGKTLCTIALVSQLLCHGAQGVVIDRADHYAFLASLIPGSRHLSIGHSASRHAINPWDVEDPDHVEPERITYLLDLHALLMGELDANHSAYGLSDREQIILEDSITATYKHAARRRTSISERDLHSTLIERARTERERGAHGFADIADDLAWRVRRFTGDGPYAHLLDRETTVDLDAPLVVFDTRDVSPKFTAGVMYLIGEHVAAGIARRQAARSAVPLPADAIFGRSFLVLEEAWALVDHDVTGRWVSDMARRSRHLGLALVAVTQQLDDLAASAHGKALLRQSSMQLFFHQQGDDLEVLREACKLSEREVDLIASLTMVRGRYSQAYWANGTRRGPSSSCATRPRSTGWPPRTRSETPRGATSRCAPTTATPGPRCARSQSEADMSPLTGWLVAAAVIAWMVTGLLLAPLGAVAPVPGPTTATPRASSPASQRSTYRSIRRPPNATASRGRCSPRSIAARATSRGCARRAPSATRCPAAGTAAARPGPRSSGSSGSRPTTPPSRNARARPAAARAAPGRSSATRPVDSRGRPSTPRWPAA